MRILLVPGFVAALLVADGQDTRWRLAAVGIFTIAIATDRLDGDLARRRGLITAFGTIADPIADKLLTGSALICLSYLGELPIWVTVAVLTREVGITLLRLILLRSVVLPAGRGGKLKTFVQSAAIGLYLLPLAGAGRVL
ncbi:MAG: CDP-alcohol phosphatidyltransferase family protein, partial [Angustibacter sp.]